MTSILDNLLRHGQLDDEGARLLYATVLATARSRNYPPPADHDSWTSNAVQEAAHDFLTGHRATERLVQIAVKATDDDSFGRLLNVAVLNWFRDGARRTVVGRQIRRLKDVCGADESMAVNDHGVRLKSSADRAYADSEDMLVSAALGVPVQSRRWRPDAVREGPEADRADSLAIVRAVLTVAESRVAWPQLGRVFARRFDLITTPAVLEVDGLDPRPSLSGYARVDVADEVDAILQQLDVRERAVLPLLDMSSREAAQLLPYGHSTIANTQRRLREWLPTVLQPNREGEAVLAELVQRLTEGP